MSQHFLIIDKASELTPGALSFLKSFDENYFPTPWTHESWDQLFKTGGEKFVLLSEQNGFALFDLSNADSFAHLLKIVVDPKKRGSGLGKSLLNEALRVLKERGIKSFFLEVEEGNTPAIKLYERSGFKTVHTKKHFYSNGATALIMTLDMT